MSNPTPSPPPNEGRVLSVLNAAKSLSLFNVLILFLLVLLVLPVYVVYKALSDDRLLDRLMSTYEDLGSHNGCTVRHVQERGGPDLWSVASGFAFQGNDRWQISVILQEQPEGETLAAFCDSLKLIADRMLERGSEDSSEVQSGPVQGAAPDGGGDTGVPAAP